MLWSGILYRLGSSYITLSVPQIGTLETIFDVVNTIRVLFDLGFFLAEILLACFKVDLLRNTNDTNFSFRIDLFWTTLF